MGEVRNNHVRRLDLDWLRIAAFGLLILYHTGMYYVPWPWHIKTQEPVVWLQPFMAAINPWRLAVLFFISGSATRFMLGKWTPGELLRERVPRLLVPLLFGMAVIVPPQTYAQICWQSACPAPGSFYLAYLTATGNWTSQGAELVTPTWNHLWFVAYVLVYTLLVVVCFGAAPRTIMAIERAIARSGYLGALIVVPAVWFVGVQLFLAPHYPETHALVGDPTVHAQYFPAFLLGFLLAKSPEVWVRMVAGRWWWTIAAAAALAVYTGSLSLLIAGLSTLETAHAVMPGTFALSQWWCTGAALAWAASLLRERDGPIRRYLTEAIFPIYILHQTIIIGVAWALRPFGISAIMEAGIIIMTTATGSIAGFELIRRNRFASTAFGLRSDAFRSQLKRNLPLDTPTD